MKNENDKTIMPVHRQTYFLVSCFVRNSLTLHTYSSSFHCYDNVHSAFYYMNSCKEDKGGRCMGWYIFLMVHFSNGIDWSTSIGSKSAK